MIFLIIITVIIVIILILYINTLTRCSRVTLKNKLLNQNTTLSIQENETGIWHLQNSDRCVSVSIGPFLPTWFNFNPSMYKLSHVHGFLELA